LNIAYSYMRGGNYPSTNGNGGIHALRLAFAWTPARVGY
jgi:hypothetical protein